MSNSVGNQKALVANKHIFPTEAFWFPTVGNQKALVANKHIFPTKAFWFPTKSSKKAIWPGFGPKLPFSLLILQFYLFQNLPFEASFSFLLALWAFSLLKPFGSLLNLTMSNPVGNQKALVANKHIFPTEAFWFPTGFNNVKFSREPKGVSSK